MAERSLLPVKGSTSLFRDPISGAVINKNVNEYRKTIETRKRAVELNNTIKDLTESVRRLESTVRVMCDRLDALEHSECMQIASMD